MIHKPISCTLYPQSPEGCSTDPWAEREETKDGMSYEAALRAWSWPDREANAGNHSAVNLSGEM